MTMKIEIFKEEDRLEVAAILVKNGYKVWQGKEKKTPTGKAYVYFIEAHKVKKEDASDERTTSAVL